MLRSAQGRSSDPSAEPGSASLGRHQRTAQESVETTDTLAALSEAIEGKLSPHKREVLVALTLNEVPIDVLTSGSTRPAAL